MKLLIVDDDRMLAELARRALMEEGHTVDLATDGPTGRMLAFVNQYDAVLLDVGLPGVTGLEVVQAMRRQQRDTPVLLLTGRREPEDVVRGLDAGADDYLTKPFDLDVLKARVRALLRRGGPRRDDSTAFGGLVLDRRRRIALADGRAIPLSSREFTLLAYLLAHADTVVTRSELLEKVWEMDFDPQSNVVDVHVARVRRKLRDTDVRVRIDTVRGVGFVLTAAGGDAASGPARTGHA